MKKILKIIGIIILIVVVLIIAFIVKNILTPAVPRNYMDKTETGGEIEKKYLSMGDHKVKYYEQKTDESFKKYEVYYPEDLNKQYPLVIFVNGSGIKGSKYKTLFRHLASWGFIVAGSEDESSGDGISTDKVLTWMLEQNDNADSMFYQKIDTNNIGLSGHSQGGAGTLAAITTTDHKEYYKTAVALSPTHEELAQALNWNYDLDKVSIPILLLAGTEGEFETETVIPLERLLSMYEKINAPKAMARRTGAEHGDMLYEADGYVTAWFMWQLYEDPEAKKAFISDDPELLKNPLYQDQNIDAE